MPFDPSKITLEADAMSFIRRYDARCKRVLSNRMVLAHLLRATMEEFGDIDAEVIATRSAQGMLHLDMYRSTERFGQHH